MTYLENNKNRIKLIVLEVLNHEDNLNIQLHGEGVNLSPTRNSRLITNAILASRYNDEPVIFRVNKMHPDGHKDSVAYLCIDMFKQDCIVEIGLQTNASQRQIRLNTYSEYLADLSNYSVAAQLKKYADNPISIYESGVSV
tara:strand:+ start:777 stop:1199 length:423 start_codon:yes stop_codon:yes gene_type:complete